MKSFELNYKLFMKGMFFMCGKTLRRGISILIFAFISFMGLGCMTPRALTQYETLERFAESGESEIVVAHRYVGVGGKIHINLNGQELGLMLRPGESATIVVPNGSHTICGRHLLAKDCGVNTITLDLTSERAVIGVNTANLLSAFSSSKSSEFVNITNVAQIPLSEN